MNMQTYTCPMHPEIERSKPGRCPKCGMKLVLKSEVSTMSTHIQHDAENSLKDYLPLVVVIGLILLTTFALSYKDYLSQTLMLTKSISYFMTGFFLTFAGFKLMDLEGFAEGYSTYDLLAKRVFSYGYIYPFIELLFGLFMILIPESKLLLWSEVIVMIFSGLGVAIKLAKKEKFQCACLGTFLKVPLTKVTLIEDFGMAFLALLMLML